MFPGVIEIGVSVALLSAASQATVHMIWKSAGDKLVIRALIGLIATVVMTPAIFFVPGPTQLVWAWLAASVLIHLVYQLVLIEAYKALDFSVAYPLARGVSPIATAILGIVILGDNLAPLALGGIVIVSAGLLTISSGSFPHKYGLIAAIFAGLLTTAYSIIDAQGVRAAENAITFIVWFFVLDGVGILAISIARRGKRLPSLMKQEGINAIYGGTISLVGYAGALLAFRFVSVGAAAALRETSVAFATLLARFFLKEKIPARRLVGIFLILAGTILIGVNL